MSGDFPETGTDPLELARRLVAIPSVNPDLEEGGTGEAEIARFCADWLEGQGFEVEWQEVAPGRPNVVGREGEGPPRILLNGHLDTVGVGEMTVPPFAAEIRDGRLRGRGAADMKGGIAALLSAAARVGSEERSGEIVVALTADEERASVGMQGLLEQGVEADAGVVCEPTGLAVMPAHKGFSWIELIFEGRAAHGSRPERGVDAIRHAGRFLASLDGYEVRTLAGRDHPLLGAPSIHAGTIRGGSAPSVYPAECTLVLERRTLPGESSEDVVREVEKLVGRLEAEISDLDVEIRPGLFRAGTEVPEESAVVRLLGEALRSQELPSRVEGMTAWVDAGLLNQAGIPTVCFGPGSIEQAHTADEWVEVAQLQRAADVLAAFLRSFLVDESPGGR